MQRIEIVILEWCKAMLGQESGVNEPKPETLISIDFFFSIFKWVTSWKPSVKVGGIDSY